MGGGSPVWSRIAASSLSRQTVILVTHLVLHKTNCRQYDNNFLVISVTLSTSGWQRLTILFKMFSTIHQKVSQFLADPWKGTFFGLFA